MTVAPKPSQGRRCGWPDRNCGLPDAPHIPEPGTRRIWTFHDVQCQTPNPRPGPHLDGYPVCSLIDGHAGDCDYRRHAAVITDRDLEALATAVAS